MATVDPAREVLLRDHQAAPLIGIQPQTMRRWRSEALRGLPLRGPKFIRIGTRVRYRLADVRAYLERCERETDRALGIDDSGSSLPASD